MQKIKAPKIGQGTKTNAKPSPILIDLTKPESIEDTDNTENYNKVEDDDHGIDIRDDDDDEMEQEESGSDDLSDAHKYSRPEKKIYAGSITCEGKKILWNPYPNIFKDKKNLENIEIFIECFKDEFKKFIEAPADKCFYHLKPLTQKTIADYMLPKVSETRKKNSKKDDLDDINKNSVTSWLSKFASTYYIKINDLHFDVCDLFDQTKNTLTISEFAIAVLISGNDIWPVIDLIDTDVERAEKIENKLDDILEKEIRGKLFIENEDPKNNITQAGKNKVLKNAYDFACQNHDLILSKYF